MRWLVLRRKGAVENRSMRLDLVPRWVLAVCAAVNMQQGWAALTMEVRKPSIENNDTVEEHFWMPALGNRSYHGDVGDRWGSDSELEQASQEGDMSGKFMIYCSDFDCNYNMMAFFRAQVLVKPSKPLTFAKIDFQSK